MTTTAVVPLDPTLDQIGFQPAVVQAFDDPNTPEQENWVAFGIFDTGASVVTLSVNDSFFFEPPFPIKVPGGAVAEGIGGVLTGDVSQPVTALVDGLGAASLEFEEILPGVLFPNFTFTLDNAISTPGVQVFVGTLADAGSSGSAALPTIAGTPMLNPTPTNPNGLAVVFEPEGELLDLTDFAEGLLLPVPDIDFVQPDNQLSASEQVSDSGTVNDPATTTTFVGDEALLNVDDIYVGFTLRFVGGALDGEARVVTDYDGATRTFTFEAGFSSAPASGAAFEIVRFSSAPIEIDLEFVGEEFANYPNPGNEVTIAANPVHNGISLSHNGATIADQNFLFDTGAMLSTITTGMRDALGLDPNAPDGMLDIGGAGGVVSSIPGYVLDEFIVPTSDGGTLTFTDVWVFVLDVSDEIGGIWGMNMFNPAAQFQYDPFDPDGTPSLQVSFFEDRIQQPLPALEDSEQQALLSLPFAGALGFGSASVPGFGVNLQPTANPSSWTTAEDTALSGTVTGTDAEGSPLTFTTPTGPSSGTLVLNPNGTYTYTPDANFHGTDSFTFQTSDGLLISDPVTVTITVTPVNDGPSADADAISVGEHGKASGDLLTNDADLDGDALMITAVNSKASEVGQQIVLSSGALVTVNAGGAFAYDPNGAFTRLSVGETATDSFTYTVSDGQGGSATATASITIQGGGAEVLIGFSDGSWQVATSTGSAFQFSTWASWANVPWSATATGDLNGDGSTDVLGLYRGSWYVGVATGAAFVTSRWAKWGDAAWKDVRLGDVNGDGQDDLLARVGGTWWAALSTGSGFAPPTIWAKWANLPWQHVTLTDLDADGDVDLLAYRSGSWWVGLSTGSSFQTARWAKWGNVAWEALGTFDADNDGQTDLYGLFHGRWYVGRSTGTSFATVLRTRWADVDWKDIVTGDFDGDGTDDLAARYAGGWYVNLSKADGTAGTTARWATWADVAWTDLRVGDYDGDGRDDIVGRYAGRLYVGASTGTAFATSMWGRWTNVAWQALAVGDAESPPPVTAASSQTIAASRAITMTVASDEESLQRFWSRASEDEELAAGLLAAV